MKIIDNYRSVPRPLVVYIFCLVQVECMEMTSPCAITIKPAKSDHAGGNSR